MVLRDTLFISATYKEKDKEHTDKKKRETTGYQTVRQLDRGKIEKKRKALAFHAMVKITCQGGGLRG
jgi:hypothetical protein